MDGSASFKSPQGRHSNCGAPPPGRSGGGSDSSGAGFTDVQGASAQGVDMQYSYLELAATRHEERARRLDQRLNAERALRKPVIEPVVPATPGPRPTLASTSRPHPAGAQPHVLCMPAPERRPGAHRHQAPQRGVDGRLRARSSRSRGRLKGCWRRIERRGAGWLASRTLTRPSSLVERTSPIAYRPCADRGAP